MKLFRFHFKKIVLVLFGMTTFSFVALNSFLQIPVAIDQRAQYKRDLKVFYAKNDYMQGNKNSSGNSTGQKWHLSLSTPKEMYPRNEAMHKDVLKVVANDEIHVQNTAEKVSLKTESTWDFDFNPISGMIVSDLNGRDPGRLWYDEKFDWDDRILAQLRYKTPNINKPPKLILNWGGFRNGEKSGQSLFIEKKCEVKNCHLTDRNEDITKADAVIFHHYAPRSVRRTSPKQIFILSLLESPNHTPNFASYRNFFNWTATYRHDSTIVAPYEKFVPYDSSALRKPQEKNVASGKSKKVAWFVSNCSARNRRLEFAKELGKYINVDIYGRCGSMECPRHTKDDQCFKMLSKKYKFYLAFENSNCKDYITEKLYWNGLGNDVLPIVMGARPIDLKRSAPVHSYIHVNDFNSTKELAEYLHYLDNNDKEYNKYFEWKGTGTFIDTKFLCRLCGLLHAVDDEKHYEYVEDMEKWWRGGACIRGKWQNGGQ